MYFFHWDDVFSFLRFAFAQYDLKFNLYAINTKKYGICIWNFKWRKCGGNEWKITRGKRMSGKTEGKKLLNSLSSSASILIFNYRGYIQNTISTAILIMPPNLYPSPCQNYHFLVQQAPAHPDRIEQCFFWHKTCSLPKTCHII